MELEELKAGWNVLDARLQEQEVVNLRLVKEMITHRTQTAHEALYKLNLRNFVVAAVMICVVGPWIYAQTPISPVSFAILEVAMLVGLVPQVWKFALLSRFDLEGKQCNELWSLMLRYKQACHRETLWAVAGFALAAVAFYVSELGFNTEVHYVLSNKVVLVVVFTLLTLGLACAVGLWQHHRNEAQLREIAHGLEELKDFQS